MDDLRSRLLSALAKPIAENRECKSLDDFDPWEDVIQGIHGGYSSESDELMIDVLKAVRDRKTFEIIKEKGFAAEFMLYVLSGHDLTEYGTSPRGGWPYHKIEDLWQPLIDKWVAYAEAEWGPKTPTTA
jgi:hypothetical protein